MKPKAADIVFFQQYAVPYFGILSIHARMRKFGYEADVIIDDLEDDFLTALAKTHPKIIGISLLSTEHKWLIKRTHQIKKALPDTLILVGGIHAMFFPEEILKECAVDLVCHSEGEDVIIELLNAFKTSPKPDLSKIDGLGYLGLDGELIKTPLAKLPDFDLDEKEERELYFDRYPVLAKDKVYRFFSSRGCPYRCSFCYNATIHDQFKDQGTYIRQKSVDSFIAEIKRETLRSEIASIFFYDDLFTFNRKWLREFLPRYRDEIGIPFWCTTFASFMTDEIADLLAEAGCQTVSFGIETGNQELRRKVLKKPVSDTKIIACAEMLHQRGIAIQTANMFCLPDETFADALRTIELNIEAKTDYAFCSLFLPIPKTELADYCTEKGYLARALTLDDMPESFLTASLLNIPDKDKIRNVHRLAYFFIKWPWFFKIGKPLVGWTFLTPLFELIYLYGNLLRHCEERGITILQALPYAWRMRKSF